MRGRTKSQNYIFAEENRRKQIKEQRYEEHKLRERFREANIKYSFKHIMKVGNDMYNVVDFYLPKRNLIVQVEGRNHGKQPQGYTTIKLTKRGILYHWDTLYKDYFYNGSTKV
jgi:very-short-patch-repair endonuclease